VFSSDGFNAVRTGMEVIAPWHGRSMYVVPRRSTLDALAGQLRHFLALGEENAVPGSEDQRRDSANWGGAYWLFDVLGVKIRLVTNAGEMETPERAGYGYYVVVETPSDTLSRELAEHVARILANSGMEVVVDQLR